MTLISPLSSSFNDNCDQQQHLLYKKSFNQYKPRQIATSVEYLMSEAHPDQNSSIDHHQPISFLITAYHDKDRGYHHNQEHHDHDQQVHDVNVSPGIPEASIEWGQNSRLVANGTSILNLWDSPLFQVT